MEYRIKPFEELDIIDDYMANAVASDPVVGKDFSRALVEGLLQVELGEHIRVNVQRFLLGDTPERRGIRMDINLPNLYVIMITNYDPFGFNQMMYTIRNHCEEVSELDYKDGLCFLYFNTTGELGGNIELKKFLSYIQNSTVMNVKDEATKRLHDYLSIVKESPEERIKYMMWEEKLFYERRDGREEERLRAVKKKVARNKSVEQIADDLETTVEEAKEYVDMVKAQS